jgi:hypothetical protein
MGISSSLSIPAGLTVDLDPVSLFLFNRTSDVSFTKVDLPGYKLKGESAIVVKDQIVKIDNSTELVSFLRAAFLNEKVTLNVRGSTTAHLGALKADVTLDKSVEINALRELEGFGLQSARLIFPPEADGTNIVGNLTLPNWSTLAIGLGNVTLNAKVANLIIGKVSLFNVFVPPGNATLPYRGELFLATMLRELPTVLTSQIGPVLSGSVEIIASGNSTMVNGEHIPYLEEVLNSISLTARIPLGQLLRDVVNSFVGEGSSGLGGIVDAISGLLSGLLGGNSTGSALNGLLNIFNLTQQAGISNARIIDEASKLPPFTLNLLG